MNIVKAIRMLGEMEAAGVIGRHAIGGAVAATFYLEPVTTLDLDVFVMLSPAPGQVLVDLGPVYSYLKARILQFIEAGALDLAVFQAILARHGLIDRWDRFERQFLREQS